MSDADCTVRVDFGASVGKNMLVGCFSLIVTRENCIKVDNTIGIDLLNTRRKVSPKPPSPAGLPPL